MTHDVPAGKTRNPTRMVIVCRHESAWEFFSGSEKLASGRTSAAHPVDVFEWQQEKDISADTTCTLKFKQRAESPETTVDAFYQASDK